MDVENLHFGALYFNAMPFEATGLQVPRFKSQKLIPWLVAGQGSPGRGIACTHVISNPPM